MQRIRYTTGIEGITEDGLKALFLSVNWESGKYPDQVLQAMQGSHSIEAAWEGDKMIGLVNALSDGVLTAYFHYMLVHPDYQGEGVGRMLMERMLHRYEGCKTKVLIGYAQAVGFYEQCGFTQEEGTKPLFISELVAQRD